MEQIRYKKLVDSRNALSNNISNKRDLENRRKRKATSREVRLSKRPKGPDKIKGRANRAADSFNNIIERIYHEK